MSINSTNSLSDVTPSRTGAVADAGFSSDGSVLARTSDVGSSTSPSGDAPSAQGDLRAAADQSGQALADQKGSLFGAVRGGGGAMTVADNYKYLRDDKGKYILGEDQKFILNPAAIQGRTLLHLGS